MSPYLSEIQIDKKEITMPFPKKKPTDTFYSFTIDFSDVEDLNIAGGATLTEELNDAIQKICEGYGIA